jgi:DNA-binding MarR family transcriptional regulator
LDVFRALDPEMPSQTISTFIAIAERHPQGATMDDLIREVGQAQSSASRNVAALGAMTRQGRRGLELVYQREDPMDARRRWMFLTPAGERLARVVEEMIR